MKNHLFRAKHAQPAHNPLFPANGRNILYAWKRKYCDVDDARKLRALEDENRRLKQIVAEQLLRISLLEQLY